MMRVQLFASMAVLATNVASVLMTNNVVNEELGYDNRFAEISNMVNEGDDALGMFTPKEGGAKTEGAKKQAEVKAPVAPLTGDGDDALGMFTPREGASKGKPKFDEDADFFGIV